ncbi:MAG: hypothetical protein ACLSVD_19075 [Eggerthellaceae bacterium]
MGDPPSAEPGRRRCGRLDHAGSGRRVPAARRRPWMRGAVAVSGIAGTCLLTPPGWPDSPKHYVLATLSSLAGIVAAALALCLLGMLVSFVVSVITTVLVAVFIVAILIGLLNS